MSAFLPFTSLVATISFPALTFIQSSFSFWFVSVMFLCSMEFFFFFSGRSGDTSDAGFDSAQCYLPQRRVCVGEENPEMGLNTHTGPVLDSAFLSGALHCSIRIVLDGM